MYQIRYPFDSKIVPQIQEYLEKAHPREAGGLVVNNTWIPLQNLSSDPEEEFDFDATEYDYWKTKGDIQAIIHSHNDWPHASQQDMESQIQTGVPWGIVSIKSGRAVDAFFWGDQVEPAPLVGRPFHHGAHDCYALVRDYYKTEYDIYIKDYPRNYGWWKEDPPLNLLEDYFKDCGFYEVPYEERKPGDVMFFRIRYKPVNHSAVYIGNDLMIHHFCTTNGLSRQEPIFRWLNYLCYTVRYKGLDDD